MFMPWYTYKLAYHSRYYITDIRNVIAQPFIYNNVTFDYDNIQNIVTRVSYYDDEIKSYGIIIDNIRYNFVEASASETSFLGFPNMLYTTTEITNTLFIKQPSTYIRGKYKLNNTNVSLPFPTLSYGSTLPIKLSINGINFKYLVIASHNTWQHVGQTSNKYIGGYNTPYNMNARTAPPDWVMFKIKIGETINLDFGNTPQEIPQSTYDWFIQQFDKVYENVYTIKSTTGETLTTLTEAPPMTSATLSAVGSAKYLTLKGENNTNYTMEWTSETPQGKIFAGLATSKGGSIVIPVGETTTINFTDSTDLYEVWQTYRPPTTTFDINLYKNSAEPNKVDKTGELSTVGTISGVLRQECSLINPEIIIQYDKPPDFNYCYIANFGRYYYVENIVSMRSNLWRVRLRCDVLMTYKTQILNLTARIARQQYTYSYRQIDSEIPFTNDPEITVEDIPNGLNLGTPGDENILLTVVTDGT